MKPAIKIILTILVLIVAAALLILLVPPMAMKVAAASGVALDKVKSVAAHLVGGGMGIFLVTYGIAALAAAPILGGAMVVIGLVALAYSLWPLFRPVDASKVQLQKVA